MATYWQVIFFSLIGGVFSLIGGLLILSKKQFAQKLAVYATPFAAGALLAAVFFDLLVEGIEEADAATVLYAALAGIVLFFFAERFLRWFHHHHEHKDTQLDPAVGLIVVGDTLHNALDGVAIAAAFLISVPTGIVTTVAVAAHEIPHEIGDFGLLLSKGMRRGKVLLVNIISALATTVAAVITFAIGSADKLPLGTLLGLVSGFLLYIAMSDLIPTIHDTTPARKLLAWRPLILLFGLAVVWTVVSLAE